MKHKHILRTFWGCCFLTFSLFSPLSSVETTFSSDEVSYDNNELNLKGNVFIENILGTFKANSAKLTRGKNSSQPNFLSGTFQESVELTLAENKRILCDAISIDFLKLQAHLSSQDGLVTYQDNLHDILLESKLLNCSWEETSGSNISVKDLVAKDAVKITYLNQFFALADKAHFYKRSRSNGNLLHGILELTRDRPEEKCSLQYANNAIYSDKILLDTKTKTILFKNPSGTLSQKRKTDFASDRLIWRPSNHVMILSNNIEIQDNTLGKIFAKDRMEILQNPKSTSFEIDKLRVKGLTHWTSGAFSFTCEGKVSYEAKKQSITAVSDKLPLQFLKDSLSIQSMKASFPTSQTSNTLLQFTDSVFIRNQALSATANQMIVDPKFETIELIGNNEHRVLLWDIKKNLQISAEKITITKDPDTKERTITGYGRVQFRFDKDDLQKLDEVMKSCMKSLS